jgi:branched-chain amino acid transport system substrate-binding protein
LCGSYLFKEDYMKSTTGKVLLLLAAFILVSVGVFAGGQEEGGPIKIGVAGAHTGDLASYGIPSVRAAEIVAENYNAAGGILGRQIELVVEDDQCKAEVAANVAAKLVGENVVAVIGHICSGATKPAAGIYNESNILCISSSATNTALTKSGDYPNFFRSIAPDDAQAALDADFVINTLKSKKAAVLHDKGDYGKGFAELTKGEFEADGSVEVVLYEGITVGAVDYSAVINKIKNSGADVIVYGGYHPEASKLVQQMKTKGMDIDFVSDDGVKDDTFIKVAGEYSEGVYASGPIDTSSNPLAQKAIKEHQDKYGEEPGPFYLNAYAAATALFNAIQVAGSTDYNAVTKAMRSANVDTCLGTISFDERGDAVGIGFSVFQVQNGEYVTVK